ncbi:MAG: hypothetical protein LBD11_02585 [Candidatus Peribacteria bacterium]|jgi:hypothetical protein|nr:hypothetical protein [Candidatus Peribacteria bacterium]
MKTKKVSIRLKSAEVMIGLIILVGSGIIGSVVGSFIFISGVYRILFMGLGLLGGGAIVDCLLKGKQRESEEIVRSYLEKIHKDYGTISTARRELCSSSSQNFSEMKALLTEYCKEKEQAFAQGTPSQEVLDALEEKLFLAVGKAKLLYADLSLLKWILSSKDARKAEFQEEGINHDLDIILAELDKEMFSLEKKA